MKFPLRERPFPSVSLSPQQCEAYESLLHTVVDATLEERQRFVRHDKRVLDKKLWKAVKRRDDISVYKRIGSEPPVMRGRRRISQRQPAENYQWRMPKMIAVGTIAGSLDDIMYGIVAPDAASMIVKSSYVNNEIVDGAVLHEIRGASHEDPFHFTGLKWMVKAHTHSLNTMVWPRDFVFVESTGVRTFRDGSRMGFHAMHSVDHPHCQDLEFHGIVRSQLSSCYLYFQRDPGTVEVYMMSYVEPGGNAPEAVGVMSAANTMIGIWKSVWCAQNKMLAHLLTNDPARRRFRAASSFANAVPSGSSRQVRCCTLCTKAFGSFRSVTECQLCSAWVCSKCRIARKVSFSDDTLELTQQVVQVCKSCIAHVAVADTFSAATDQYVQHAPALIEEEEAVLELPQPKTLETKQAKRPRHYSAESSGTQPGSLSLLGSSAFNSARSWRYCDDVDDAQTPSRETFESVVMETIGDWEQQQKSVPMLSPPAASSVRSRISSFHSSKASDLDDDDLVLDHQERLMRTMHSLCLAAEQTYQITSFTASLVQDSSAREVKAVNEM
jgi:hypothetical protein